MGIKVESKLDYGQEVMDNVTGFMGKVVAITQYQHGCVRIGVQCKIDKDGKLPKVEWIDEPDLTGEPAQVPAGPQQDAKRHIDSDQR